MLKKYNENIVHQVGLHKDILSYITARTHKDSLILTTVLVTVLSTVYPKKPQTTWFRLFAGCQMCFSFEAC